MTDSPGQRQFSLRALLLGVFLAALINVGSPYSLYILDSSKWTVGYLPSSVVVLFTALVFLNAVLVSWAKVRLLSATELGLVFIMALVSASIPTWGTSTYLIAVIAAPQYFASPENGWNESIVRFIQTWLVPQDALALKWFYNGIPAGKSIPWGAWAVPLFWWISLVMAVFFFCHCLVAALRKQWVEYERLPFALMEVPQQLISIPEGSAWPGFVHKRVFWIGFGLPFAIVMWNTVTYFTPAFPPIPTAFFGYLQIGREFPAIEPIVNFAIVGCTFFVHLDVSFSIWFFTLLTMLQEGLFNRLGFTIPGRDVYTMGPEAIGWQAFGAMAVMVVNLFWIARGHFRNIWRKAWTNDPAIDDSDELMSYRSLVIGLALSLLYIVFWLWRSGMSFLGLSLFILATIILYTGITRVVMEGGLLFVRGPLVGQTFVGYALGGPNMSVESHVAFGLSYSWHHELEEFFMAASANSSKITDHMKMRRSSVTICIMLAALVAVLVSTVYALYMGYSYGAYNYGGWMFDYGSQVPYVEVLRKINETEGPDWTRLGFAGLGAGIMGWLIFMRYRFPWWPIHPIGMPVGICSYPVTIFIFSIFLAWLLKWIIMRSGGIQLYHRAQPFFIGIILGYFTGIGISFVVDMIWFPGQGHSIYPVIGRF